MILLLIPFSFAACASDGAKGESEDIHAEKEPEDIRDFSNGTPWPMVDLDGVVTEDTPADAKDNFALFANKDQILSRELKKDDSIVGTMYDVIQAGEQDEQKMYAGMKLAKNMLVKLGYTEDEAQQKIDNALAFETSLATAIYTSEEQGNEDIIERSNNHYTRDELKEAEGKLPILELLDNTGYPKDADYVVSNPGFLKKLNELYTEENLPLMKDLIIVKSVICASTALFSSSMNSWISTGSLKGIICTWRLKTV